MAANPGDGVLRGSLAMALALPGGGRRRSREGEQAMQLEPIATNGITGPIVQHFLVLAYLALGDHDAALDRLEPLLRVPFYLSPAWLRIDPTLAPLSRRSPVQTLDGRRPPTADARRSRAGSLSRVPLTCETVHASRLS